MTPWTFRRHLGPDIAPLTLCSIWPRSGSYISAESEWTERRSPLFTGAVWKLYSVPCSLRQDSALNRSEWLVAGGVLQQRSQATFVYVKALYAFCFMHWRGARFWSRKEAAAEVPPRPLCLLTTMHATPPHPLPNWVLFGKPFSHPPHLPRVLFPLLKTHLSVDPVGFSIEFRHVKDFPPQKVSGACMELSLLSIDPADNVLVIGPNFLYTSGCVCVCTGGCLCAVLWSNCR